MHPRLKTREGKQQILPTRGEGQEEDIQGDSSEELVVINWNDEHDYEWKYDKYSMKDEPFLES